MRAIAAAVLLAGLGAGCCKTCGGGRNDVPGVRDSSRLPMGTRAPVAPEATAGATGAPAGTPVGRVGGTGAYGGTGN